MANINDLNDLAIPPIAPVDTGSSDGWRNVELKLGTELPADYRTIVSTYGAGLFSDFIFLLNPFHRSIYGNYHRQIGMTLEAYQSGRDSFPELCPPFPPFPEPNGLLPALQTENGDVGYWITDGLPSKWPLILCESRDLTRFDIFEFDLTTFLVEAIAGRLRTQIFGRLEPFACERAFVPFDGSDQR